MEAHSVLIAKVQIQSMEVCHKRERPVNSNMGISLGNTQVLFMCVRFVGGEEKEVIVGDMLETADEVKSADGQQDVKRFVILNITKCEMGMRNGEKSERSEFR